MVAIAAHAAMLTQTARVHAQCDDDPLAEAAATLVLSGENPTGDALTSAARAAGSDAPSVHALRVPAGDSQRVARWLDELGGRLHAPLVCGEARTAEHRFVVAAPAAGHLALLGGAEVRVTLAPRWEQPVLFVEDATGQVVRLEPDGERVTLPIELEPPLHLQLVARGPDGPRPVAERSTGEGPDTRVPSSGAPLDERIAALRRRAQVGPLRPHRILSSVAQAHAETVCRARRAAHEVEPGRDPRARLRARHVEARHVGETVARGATPDAAFDALARSTAHREALVDRRFTDAGAGLALDGEGHACVVVLLAAWPRLVVAPP